MFASRLFGLATAALVLAAPHRAATVRPMSIEEMAVEATSIVRARVAGSRVEAAGPLIYTVYALEVSESLKGRAPTASEIALPGGRLGAGEQHYSGVPDLRRGREYVLFLWRGPSGRTQAVGLSQGVLRIEIRGDEVRVRRGRLADAFIAPGEDRAGDDEEIDMAFDEFAARVRAGLAAQREKQR